MARTLNVLFSQPPAGVSDDEYEQWYADHLPEILTIPGFVAAQQFRLEMPEGHGAGAPFRYAVLYETETSFEEAMAEMERQSLSSYEQYQEWRRQNRPDADPIPDWFTGISFGWWSGVAVGPVVRSESE